MVGERELGLRPVMVLLRPAVLPVLARPLVAPLTTRVRSLPTEVALDTDDGLPGPCVVSLDNIQPLAASLLVERITHLGPAQMSAVSAPWPSPPTADRFPDRRRPGLFARSHGALGNRDWMTPRTAPVQGASDGQGEGRVSRAVWDALRWYRSPSVHHARVAIRHSRSSGGRTRHPPIRSANTGRRRPWLEPRTSALSGWLKQRTSATAMPFERDCTRNFVSASSGCYSRTALTCGPGSPRATKRGATDGRCLRHGQRGV